MESLQWTVTVDRPQAEVFAYLADIAKHGDWSPKPWRMEGTEEPLTLGTKFTSYGYIPGDEQHRNDVECTTFEAPNKIELTTQEDNGIFVTAYVLTSEGSGTKVEKTMDFPSPKGFEGLIFPVLKTAYIKPSVQKGMRNLKHRLESQAS